ncbi:MAG: glycoside hydrolase family 3 N-terminal domain-containing protein [Nitrospirota bacterium]
MPGPEQKYYQIIISRLDGHKLSSVSYQEQLIELVSKGIGGFIIFGGEKRETSDFIDKLQSLAGTHLFIASDIERGVGQQINGATSFPGQMAAAAATDLDDSGELTALEEAIEAIAHESIDIGINMPLVPVLDVNSNPDNPIICSRAFSDRPDIVSRFGKLYINTLERTGLISCAKHFPGHGDTAVDSHISLPVISKSLDELRTVELAPFIEAVKANVSSIMIGHISVPAIDKLPASLSVKAVDLLRRELGHEGIILTDALNMHALKEIPDAAVKCVNAGVDILLHPENPDAVAEEIKQAVIAGQTAEEKIDTAVARILKYKERIKSIKKVRIDSNRNKKLSWSISDRSVTLLKEKSGLLPIKDIRGLSLVFAADEDKHDLSVLKAFIPGALHIRECQGKALRETVIVALFSRIAAWEGSSGMREEDVTIIRELIGRPCNSCVISFGNPYVLRHFMEADILIASYDTTDQAQSSVIKCLQGYIAFQGRLPVELKHS